MNAVFILNGASRSRRRFLRGMTHLEQTGVFDRVRVLETRRRGQAIDLARQHCIDADCLVAAGGDGTLHEVINGCQQARHRDGVRDLPPIAALALGTANDFLRSEGLTGSLDELLELVRSGDRREVDIGRISYTRGDGSAGSRFFINVADAGIGAEVIAGVQRTSPLLAAELRYLVAVFGRLCRFGRRKLVVEVDGRPLWQGPALAAIAGNGRCFGSGLYAVPQARVDDGLLHLTVIGDVGLRDVLRELPRMRRAELIDHPQVVYASGRTIAIRADDPCPLEADGEYLGSTPATLEILPAALTFLLPGSRRPAAAAGPASGN